MEAGREQLNIIDILHLSHAFDIKDGGISTSVNQLVSAQKSIELKVSWATGSSFPPLQRDKHLINKVIKLDPKILHLHGLWRSHTRIASQLSQKGLPYIIAPHGMVDAWSLSQSKFRKKLGWRIWEKRAFNAAECIHALCPAEADAIRKLIPGKPIALIPNGVEIPSVGNNKMNLKLPKDWDNKIPKDASILLYLGRFHKKKGIYQLIEAWKEVANLSSGKKWWLCFVGYGPDEENMQTKIKESDIPRCLICGPAFNKEKSDILKASTSFVLPSFSEGLPIAALEAMAYGLPCLLSSSCNLPEAYEKGAAISAEPDSQNIAESLKKLFLLPSPQLKSMGEAGIKLVSCNYNWKTIGEQTEHLYEWIKSKNNPPDFLQT